MRLASLILGNAEASANDRSNNEARTMLMRKVIMCDFSPRNESAVGLGPVEVMKKGIYTWSEKKGKNEEESVLPGDSCVEGEGVTL